MSLRIPTFTEALNVARGRGRDSEAPELWNTLIALWTGLQGDGKQWYDLGGYDNRGTLTNGPTWTVDRWPAVHFAGDDDVVTVPHSDVLLPAHISISVWVKRHASKTQTVIVKDRPVDDNTDIPYILRLNDTEHVRFGTWDDGANQWREVVSIGTVSTEWTHIVGTYDGANFRVYLDGVLDNTAAWAGGLLGTQDFLTIGDRRQVVQAWDGLIGGVSIHSRALAISESQQLYVDPHALTRPRRLILPAAAAPPSFVPYPYPLHDLSGGLAI